MKERFDPLHLDVDALARQGAAIEGAWPIADLQRLAASAHSDEPPAADADVTWAARGERIERAGAHAQTWMHLRAAASMALVCQRCLGPVAADLAVQRRFLFVAGEDRAAELDGELEDDVLALARSLDLRELIEDELLLAMPLVPRHEHCPHPLVPGSAAGAPSGPEADDRQRPFEQLRGWRRSSG